jgi:hypothetical protein
VHQAQNQDVGAGNGRNPWDRGGPPSGPFRQACSGTRGPEEAASSDGRCAARPPVLGFAGISRTQAGGQPQGMGQQG